MARKYPPPHPALLKEHQEALDQVRLLREDNTVLRSQLYKAHVLNDVLHRRVNGGLGDPRTNLNHPGHLLVQLGWEYDPSDETGLNWKDPQTTESGRPLFWTLPEALAIACQRLLDRFASTRPKFDRLEEEDLADDSL